MLSLHQIRHAGGHVVSQVVETELVVGAVGNIALVGSLTGIRVGLMLIDTVYGKAVELIQGAHPFRVTLGQIVVHRNQVHALAGQRIQEHGQGCHQGFTLTGGHFCNHTALFLVGFNATVQNDTADELDIVMYHVPSDLVTTGHPVVVPDGFLSVYFHEVLSGGSQVTVKIRSRYHHAFAFCETAGRALHNSEGLGQKLIEDFLNSVVLLLQQFVGLGGQLHFLLYGDIFFQFQLNLCNAVFKRLFHICNLLAKSRAAGTELIVGKGINFGVCGQYLVKDWPDGFHVPVTLGTEDFFEYICYCHFCVNS